MKTTMHDKIKSKFISPSHIGHRGNIRLSNDKSWRHYEAKP